MVQTPLCSMTPSAVTVLLQESFIFVVWAQHHFAARKISDWPKGEPIISQHDCAFFSDVPLKTEPSPDRVVSEEAPPRRLLLLVDVNKLTLQTSPGGDTAAAARLLLLILPPPLHHASHPCLFLTLISPSLHNSLLSLSFHPFLSLPHPFQSLPLSIQWLSLHESVKNDFAKDLKYNTSFSLLHPFFSL